MNRNQYLALALLVLVTGFFGCAKDKGNDPTDDNTKAELQLKGTISGKVTDSLGQVLSGVAVTADPGGYATNTDTLGQYTIPALPGGTYTLVFTKTNWKDTTVDSIPLHVDQDKQNINIVMRWSPDAKFLEIIDSLLTPKARDVVGVLTDSARVGSVSIVARNTDGDTVPVTAATWNILSATYSVSMRVPKYGGSLTVYVRDTLGYLTGVHNEAFTAGTNEINLQPFSARNAVLHIAFPDTTVAAGSKLLLRGTVGDTANMTKVEWKVASTGTWKADSRIGNAVDTTITIPSGDNGDYRVYLRATYANGNSTIDSAIVAYGPLFTDARDGRAYRYVIINGQPWMAENLAYNGTEYYTWATAMNLPSTCNDMDCGDSLHIVEQGLCPTGWHVSDTAEWTRLTDYAGMNAGMKLKSKTGWAMDSNGTDDYSFSVYPRGYGVEGVGNFSLVHQTTESYFWTPAKAGTASSKASISAAFLHASTIGSLEGHSRISLYNLRCAANVTPAAEMEKLPAPVVGKTITLRVRNASGTYLDSTYTVQWKVGTGTWTTPTAADYSQVMTVVAGNYDVILKVTTGGVSAYDTAKVNLSGFTDGRDGSVYTTTSIGGVKWLRENVHFAGSGSVGTCLSGLTSNCTEYGRLYTNTEAQTACPSGSHLPSLAEWNTLIASTGGDSAAYYLKEVGTWGVLPYVVEKNVDVYNFTIKPGSYMQDNAAATDAGLATAFWTSETTTTLGSVVMFLYSQVYMSQAVPSDVDLDRNSVRCVVE